ncbi:MAG: PEP-CTERM sorting domain-containing protein [Planctomycetota bacterium]
MTTATRLLSLASFLTLGSLASAAPVSTIDIVVEGGGPTSSFALGSQRVGEIGFLGLSIGDEVSSQLILDSITSGTIVGLFNGISGSLDYDSDNGNPADGLEEFDGFTVTTIDRVGDGRVFGGVFVLFDSGNVVFEGSATINDLGTRGVFPETLNTASAPGPEPTSLALAGLGLAAVGVTRLRRRSA